MQNHAKCIKNGLAHKNQQKKLKKQYQKIKSLNFVNFLKAVEGPPKAGE